MILSLLKLGINRGKVYDGRSKFTATDVSLAWAAWTQEWKSQEQKWPTLGFMDSGNKLE